MQLTLHTQCLWARCCPLPLLLPLLRGSCCWVQVHPLHYQHQLLLLQRPLSLMSPAAAAAVCASASCAAAVAGVAAAAGAAAVWFRVCAASVKKEWLLQEGF